MGDNNSLDIEGLQSEFAYYMNSLPTRTKLKGQMLYENNKVGTIVFYPNEHVFRTKVSGTYPYDVELKLGSNNKTIIQGNCTCPYGEICKHQIAMIYSLIHGDNLNYSDDLDNTKPSNHKKLELTFNADRQSFSIKVDKLSDVLLNINDLKPRNLRKVDPYYSKYRHFLNGNSELESTLWLENWRTRDPDLKGTINIKFSENEIEVQCPNCTTDENSFCSCAFNIMQESIRLAVHLGLDKLNYDYQIKNIAVENEIPGSTAKELFQIELTSDNSFVHPKSSNVIYADGLDAFSLILNKANTGKDKELLETLEKQMDFGEAFVWSSIKERHGRPPLFLLSGKLNKTRDKFVSNIENVDVPNYLPSSQLVTFKSLDAILNFGHIPEEFNAVKLKATDEGLLNIQQSVSSLNSGINYFYKPIGTYTTYEEGLKKRDLSPFTFSNEWLSIRLKAFVENGLFILQADCYIGEVNIKIPALEKINYFFVIMEGVAYPFEHGGIYELLLAMNGNHQIKFLPHSRSSYFDLLINLENQFAIDKDISLKASDVVLTNLERSIELKEVGDHVVFRPLLESTHGNFNVLAPKPIFQKDEIILPDQKDIDHFKAYVLSQHPFFKINKEATHFLYLHRNDYIKKEWFLDFFEECRTQNIEIKGHEDFERIRFSEFKAEIKTEVSDGIDWFDLNISLKFGDEKVSRQAWIKSIKEGKSFVELKDGTLGIIPEEWFVKITKMVRLAEVSKSGLRINKLRYIIIDELFDEVKDKAILENIFQKRRLLESFDSEHKYTLPDSINATLRPYQMEGFQWLKFLEACHFGGILADDMGLGKTLQIITPLADSKIIKVCKAIIAVPKSLIFNWTRELDKFCPDLSYHIHHGLNRFQNIENFNTSDIVISTYATITKDIAQLSNMQFTHVVLDESQAIKNPASKRFKAVRLLQSQFKLCMTGTPIQNNTFDLYAQATFSNPGLLGNQSYFRQNFSIPIDKDGDTETSKLLVKLIHPFILRRTKEQVAGDLPDKVESVLYCDMYPHQRLMYNELKNRIRNDLMSLDENNKLKFMVLDGLLKLRQLCNAPLLVDPNLRGNDARSIKIDSLIYALTEEIGEGNAIVFSQFVQMLTLVRKELDRLKIPYAYLDGQTRDRAAVVDEFMNNPDCKIFLLSLKAGNTGLNLTKAQYVFIIDPWWNPAVEAQAIDRTHRIGQDKKVFAYKMICRDSVEEKIVTLQKRKKNVATQIIQTDESIFKSLDKKELLSLFE